ncbi:MAG TPA: hypothetical protein PLA88_04780 [Bacteroidales bacterium]|nr:hypothetical protein [Bacteroidales bacterium]
MKKVFSFFILIAVAGIMSISAQSLIVTVKTSADCTNLTAEFTVPEGKVAKLLSMEIITSFTSCNESQAAPAFNTARIYQKFNIASTTKGADLYFKKVTSSGTVTENHSIQQVKLGTGTYVLQVSKAPNLEAKLEYQLL